MLATLHQLEKIVTIIWYKAKHCPTANSTMKKGSCHDIFVGSIAIPWYALSSFGQSTRGNGVRWFSLPEGAFNRQSCLHGESGRTSPQILMRTGTRHGCAGSFGYTLSSQRGEFIRHSRSIPFRPICQATGKTLITNG